MEELVEQFVKYLETNLDLRLHVSSPRKPGNYPFYLTQDYTFYDAEILGHAYILQVKNSPKEITPSDLKKQWEKLRYLSNDVYPIYVTPSMTAFNRKRLIQQKIPFVVPGNQMYLPDLGLDLREYFKHKRQPREYLSPSAQHCLINFLLDTEQRESTPSQLAKKLNYTVMTMSRAIGQLVSFKLGEEQKEGGERFFRFIESRQGMWEKARELLRDPISQIKWVEVENIEKWNLQLAGSLLFPDCLTLIHRGYLVMQWGGANGKRCRRTGSQYQNDLIQGISSYRSGVMIPISLPRMEWWIRFPCISP